MKQNENIDLDRDRSASDVTFAVRVPASTSNLGAGFDCFGLALGLYLHVRATFTTQASQAVRIRSTGEGSEATLPRSGENLIVRAMRYAAEREGFSLPPLRLAVQNNIPLGRGLGSSAAAIVAGIALAGAITKRELTNEAILRYAAEIEGHADNVAAALLGGWVTTGVKDDGEVLAVRRRWPRDLRIIVVSPDVSLETARARAALPQLVERVDAVHNLQRAALFGAAIDGGIDELIWEAMQDRLHQSLRGDLVPGLSSALATPRRPGLIGIALSGAGPSVLALARDNFDEIGDEIARSFRNSGLNATVRLLEVDEEGLVVTLHDRQRRSRRTLA